MIEVPEEVLQDQARQEQRPQADKAAAPAPAPAARPMSGVAGMSRPFKYNELIGKHGGLSALHFAARQFARIKVLGDADHGPGECIRAVFADLRFTPTTPQTWIEEYSP